MIEVENTDVNIVRNLIPMRNHMPASAYGLKGISDWLKKKLVTHNISFKCKYTHLQTSKRETATLKVKS